MSVEQYECLYSLNDQSENMESRLEELSNTINTKYKTTVSRMLKINDNFFILLLSLPNSMLGVHDLWSVLNMYQWTKCTLMPSYSTKQLRPFPEKKIVINWLLPRLHNKSVELNVYPREETLRLDHANKVLYVAREVEFKLETISQNLLAKSLVKVLILRKINREVVNFKCYLHKLIEQFFSLNAEHECYCVVDILPTDSIHMLEDVIPTGVSRLIGQGLRVYSAFNPSDVPVSCLILYMGNTTFPNV